MPSIPQTVRWFACIALTCAIAAPAWAQQTAEPAPAEPALAEGTDPAAEGPTGDPAPPAPPPSVDLREALRGEGRGMTADRAAARAVATAPSVDRARQALEQARAGARRAMVGVVPDLAWTARYTRLSPVDNPPLLSSEQKPTIETVSDPAARSLWNTLAEDPLPIQRNRYEVRGVLTFPVTDVFLEVLPRWEAAGGVADAQRLRVQAEAARVALAARETFYQYVRARGALTVARIAQRQAEVQEEYLGALARTGQAGRADVLRVRAKAAAARGAVARARGGLDTASTALRVLLHVDRDAEIAVREDLWTDLPEGLSSREELIDQGMRQRPEARALRRLIAARGHEVDYAEGRRYPSLLVSGDVGLGNPGEHVVPETAEWRLSAAVNVLLRWSLHETLHGKREADEARALVGQARADLRELEDAIVREVTEAHAGYLSAREALEAARAGLEAAEEGHRVRMAQFRGGGALVSEVVDAAAERARAQLDLVNAAIDARVALARLRRATADDDPALERAPT